jgi:hypothetical protein
MNMPENQNASPQSHPDSNISTLPEAQSQPPRSDQTAAFIISSAKEIVQRAADFIALVERQREEHRQTWQNLIEREDQFLARIAASRKEWEKLKAQREAVAKEEATFIPKARKQTRRSAPRRTRRGK